MVEGEAPFFNLAFKVVVIVYFLLDVVATKTQLHSLRRPGKLLFLFFFLFFFLSSVESALPCLWDHFVIFSSQAGRSTTDQEAASQVFISTNTCMRLLVISLEVSMERG